MFSPAKIEGVGERHLSGGASVYIKAFGSTPILLQRQISTEGIGGPYPLSMLGRTLDFLMNHKLDPTKLHGQGYDRAGNMSGKANGAAAHISVQFSLLCTFAVPPIVLIYLW